MDRLQLKSWLFGGLLLVAGCQLLVDPDPKDIGGDALKDSCADVQCKSGTHCALVEVQCVKAPCEPVAQCVADDLGTNPVGDGDHGGDGDGDRDTGAGQVCGKSVCGEGTVCCNASCGICTKPGGVCIQLACDEEPPPQDEPTTCAAVLCPVDTYCDDISGQAKCLPLPSCDTTKCEIGQHCELKDVTCIRAPCPPQPTCVADRDPCETVDCVGECKVVKGKPVCSPNECQNPCLTVKCSAGHHCEAKEVQCIAAPCCPVAECVSDKGGQQCGDNTCAAGTYCCNESCGTCAPKGGVCTQQFCGQDN